MEIRKLRERIAHLENALIDQVVAGEDADGTPVTHGELLRRHASELVELLLPTVESGDNGWYYEDAVKKLQASLAKR